MMGELGICGIFVPEEYGGTGLGHVERAICLEEISRHSAGLGIALMTHHLGLAPILDHGTEEQKRKYLPDLCAGTKICGLSVTEPAGGSDFMGQKSTGEFIDGKWVLNGRKCFITNSHTADIDTWVVRTGTNEKGKPEFSAFIIEKGTPGHSPGREEPKGVPLEEAEIVICGGWGIGGQETWGHLEKIAEKLGGAVASTRPPVDEGWTPGEHIMIGTSGKSVRPKVYIGFGISGATHHICGMKDSDMIININKDENAEIFNVSDYGAVGDVKKILPLLEEALQIV